MRERICSSSYDRTNNKQKKKDVIKPTEEKKTR